MTVQDKEAVHQLVEALPASELHAARRFLEYLRDHGDSFLAWLQSRPEEEEPVSADERAAIDEGMEALRRGDVVPDEELKRELGW